MRKVDNGKRKEKEEKKMLFLVATNIVASWQLERRADQLERRALVPK